MLTMLLITVCMAPGVRFVVGKPPCCRSSVAAKENSLRFKVHRMNQALLTNHSQSFPPR